jgi:hypothetical protein
VKRAAGVQGARGSSCLSVRSGPISAQKVVVTRDVAGGCLAFGAMEVHWAPRWLGHDTPRPKFGAKMLGREPSIWERPPHWGATRGVFVPGVLASVSPCFPLVLQLFPPLARAAFSAVWPHDLLGPVRSGRTEQIEPIGKLATNPIGSGHYPRR